LLSSFDYLTYQEISHQIAALSDEEKEPLFSYIFLWYRDLLEKPEHFFPEEMPEKKPKKDLAAIAKILQCLEDAQHLHMQLSACLDVLFLEVLEQST
ncbi:MAG: hypothetical protein AAGI90_01420, partial [Chlamydiota bacterium]